MMNNKCISGFHRISILLLSLQLLFFNVLFAQDWQDLFNGRDLSNWERKNGTAEYRIEGEEVVGVSRLNTGGNSFLCTKDTYGDFILEFDVKVDPGLNSGVQIRSISDPEYNKGQVHGYQVEIDPSERAWSAGIYEEGRRGWLYPLTRNHKGREAFKNGVWNHFRVEAIGMHIRTWINGVQCSNLADDMTAEGFIALQVHGIWSEEQEGLTVRWKNIRIITENPEAYQTQCDPEVPEISWLMNKLTTNEKRKGWRLLWDGESTEGWRRSNDDHFPGSGWVIDDGILTIEESTGNEPDHGGDIITEQEFSSFELELDYRITKGANSGIKYFVVENNEHKPGSGIGLEYQILDDEVNSDAKAGVNGNRTAGSLYDLIAAENLSEAPGSGKRDNGPGEWNKARLVVKGNHVEHWQNNLKIVEYERGSQIYRNLVAKSKYAKYPGFGEAPTGHILLQDHGNRVSFRSIKIREL